jgi:hypothetical protein
MNTISEGTASAARILKTVMPTRSLLNGGKYVPAHETNVARTFRKARLLARLQGVKS